MEVLVDDRPYQATGSPDQTLRELANEVCTVREGEGQGQRFVVSLRCDGNEVEKEGIDAVLALPMSQFQRLELHTQPIAPLVASTLAKAIDLLGEAADSRLQTADLLEEGQHNEAMQRFQKLIEAWQQVQQAMVVCGQTLGINLDTLQVNDVVLNDLMESIKTQLNELKAGLENRDFVLVADILRYELDEPLTHWRTILDYLVAQVDAAT